MEASQIRDSDRSTRWGRRHRGGQRPSSAHVAEVVRPSPARAEAPEADAWLPVPDVEELPAVEDLLVGPADEEQGPDEIPVGPSPARAEPHDETAWLPLPDLDDLPAIEELLVGDEAAAPPARALTPVAPSPARAEPHDETAWLPLPEVEDLPEITELVDADRATTSAPPARPRAARRLLAPVSPRRALAAVLVAVTVAAAAYAIPKVFNNGDQVSLRVDGRVISARSGQDTVGGFLREQKVSVGPDDRIDPKGTTPLADGMTVRVLRAFPVTVDLDGDVRVRYTAYSLASDFVASLKLPPAVAVRNAPARLQAGATIQLRTRRVGTLNVDGQAVNYNLPVLTVRELLDYYKVILGPQDYTTPAVATVIPVDSPFVNVIRQTQDTTFQIVNYNLPQQILPDPNLDVGQSRDVAAVTGQLRITYEVTMANGNAVGQIPVSQVPVVMAQPPIHYFGTRADPRWEAIARCETGANWSMQGPEFSGGLGIYNGTWNAFGGAQYGGDAGQATREQQIIVAERIRARYGFGAWGCGRKLGFG
ncbi:MAG TPA: transglycosylase family protein [Acidimicrobiia bacterium]|nr:transglycosylase family protein [Acidimicrobiia bacterium]